MAIKPNNMNKLSYEAMDVAELENVMGGSAIKYAGCAITNGKCSADGGCGVCNGKCTGPIEQEPIEPTPTTPTPTGPSEPAPTPVPDTQG